MFAKRIVFNDDGWSSYMRHPAPMSAADILAVTVEPLLGTAVTVYQFCALGGHVVNYNSAFLPRVGEMMDRVDTMHVWRMRETLRALAAEGTDPLDLVANACRQHGLQCQFSLRMNDAHHVYTKPDGSWYFPELQSPWFDEHPNALLPSRQLDYEHPLVHEYRLAQMAEVLERVSVTGLDLDFTRFAPWFAPGREATGAPRMTELVRNLRALTRRTGRTLSARFEYDPQTCLDTGLAVDEWLAEGLLDQVTLGGVAAHTPDASARWWIERAHAGGARVYPGMEGQLDWLPGPGSGGTGLHPGDGVVDGYGPPSLAYMRAVAARHYADDADGVSLFNFTCADGPWAREALTELGDPAALECADKQVVATLWPPTAFPNAADWTSKLRLEPGQTEAHLTLILTDDPADAAAKGLTMQATLTLDLKNLNRLSDVRIQLNGHEVTWTGECYNHYDHGCWTEVLTFTVAATTLQRGENTLSLRRRAAHAGFDGAVEVRKCVLDVRFS